MSPAQTAAPAAPPAQLSLPQAEQIALRNNPTISIAKLAALAQGQVEREVRSGELPTVDGDLTAVNSHTGSRIAAGGLNNPLILPRAAGGVTVRQLITDFGRSRNLVASARLQQQATESAELATAADVRLSVDEAFYRALGSPGAADRRAADGECPPDDRRSGLRARPRPPEIGSRSELR